LKKLNTMNRKYRQLDEAIQIKYWCWKCGAEFIWESDLPAPCPACGASPHAKEVTEIAKLVQMTKERLRKLPTFHTSHVKQVRILIPWHRAPGPIPNELGEQNALFVRMLAGTATLTEGRVSVIAQYGAGCDFHEKILLHEVGHIVASAEADKLDVDDLIRGLTGARHHLLREVMMVPPFALEPKTPEDYMASAYALYAIGQLPALQFPLLHKYIHKQDRILLHGFRITQSF